MGVKGLMSLLRQEGRLPPPPPPDHQNGDGCGVELWLNYEQQHSSLLFSNVHHHHHHRDRTQRRIPPHSKLHIDGNGLAHHLYRVAYSRYFDSETTASSSSGSDSSSGKSNTRTTTSSSSSRRRRRRCSCPSRKMDFNEAARVTKLLPHFLPLYLLEEVCVEFMSALLLQSNYYSITIYWDGKARRMKQRTTVERKSIRDEEYSRLYEYCQHGTVMMMMMNGSSTSLCQRDLFQNFPKSRLLLAQVRSTLSRKFVNNNDNNNNNRNITMVDCEEEADVEVARAAASCRRDDNPSSYVLGLDSDYCLFESVNYVPLDTLMMNVTTSSSSSSNSTFSSVSGCVLTRRDIAEFLELPSEESMVELAILCGNDYVCTTTTTTNNKNNKNNLMTFVDHLKDQPADYRVTSDVARNSTSVGLCSGSVFLW
jgi:hypothetical protein